MLVTLWPIRPNSHCALPALNSLDSGRRIAQKRLLERCDETGYLTFYHHSGGHLLKYILSVDATLLPYLLMWHANEAVHVGSVLQMTSNAPVLSSFFFLRSVRRQAPSQLLPPVSREISMLSFPLTADCNGRNSASPPSLLPFLR
jgi:hypothetical protein